MLCDVDKADIAQPASVLIALAVASARVEGGGQVAVGDGVWELAFRRRGGRLHEQVPADRGADAFVYAGITFCSIEQGQSAEPGGLPPGRPD